MNSIVVNESTVQISISTEELVAKVQKDIQEWGFYSGTLFVEGSEVIYRKVKGEDTIEVDIYEMDKWYCADGKK